VFGATFCLRKSSVEPKEALLSTSRPRYRIAVRVLQRPQALLTQGSTGTPEAAETGAGDTARHDQDRRREEDQDQPEPRRAPRRPGQGRPGRPAGRRRAQGDQKCACCAL
jgi:hypothetical protein